MTSKRTDIVFDEHGKPLPWRKLADGQWELRMWQLEPPEQSYCADIVQVRLVRGAPTLYFAQQVYDDAPPGTYYGVTLPESRLAMILDGFEAIRERFAKRFPGREVRDFTDVDLRKVPDGRWAKKAGTVLRCSVNDEHAIMDFYQLEPWTADAAAERAQKFPNVGQLARIWATPELLFDLLGQLDTLRGKP